MRWQDHIVATPDTLHGWPRFRGTRIPVSVVLDNLACGVTPDELFADYPTLPKEAIPAALDERLAGVIDDHLLAIACSEGRVLISFDRDFANILRHPPEATGGIVVIRLHDQTLPLIRPADSPHERGLLKSTEVPIISRSRSPGRISLTPPAWRLCSGSREPLSSARGVPSGPRPDLRADDPGVRSLSPRRPACRGPDPDPAGRAPAA